MFYRLHFTTMRAARMEAGSVYLTQGQYRSLEQTFRSKYIPQIESLNRQIEELEAQLQQASAEYLQLQQQAEALQRQFEEAHDDLLTIQGQLREAQSQIQSLQTQLTAANTEVTRLTGELQQANALNQGLQGQLQEATVLNQGLQGQLDLLRNWGLWPNTVTAITQDENLTANCIVNFAFPGGHDGSAVCSYFLQNDSRYYYLEPAFGRVSYTINWHATQNQLTWVDDNGDSRTIQNVRSVRVDHNPTYNNRIFAFYYQT